MPHVPNLPENASLLDVTKMHPTVAAAALALNIESVQTSGISTGKIYIAGNLIHL